MALEAVPKIDGLSGLDLALPDGHAGTLSPAVRAFAAGAWAPSTRMSYASDLRHFLAWGGTVPAAPEDVAEYLAAYAHALTVATLRRRLSGLNAAHRALGRPEPGRATLVRMTLRGIARERTQRPQRQRPLTRELLAHVVEAMPDDLAASRDRALLLFGFAGAFRRSELRAVNCTDLQTTGHGLRVHVARSKTDPEGRGRVILLPQTGNVLCPVAAVTHWLTASHIDRGPVFRPLQASGTVGATPLSDRSIALIVKRRVAAAGLDPAEFSGHSLRRGFVATAMARGMPIPAIQAQTGHRSEAMVLRYAAEMPSPDWSAAAEVLR